MSSPNLARKDEPFIDTDRLAELLEGTKAGLTFLEFMLRQTLGDEELSFEASSILSHLQETVDETRRLTEGRPALLNPKHAQYENVCRAIRETLESGRVDRSPAPKKVQAKKGTLFLLDPRLSVPKAEPSEIPVV